MTKSEFQDLQKRAAASGTTLKAFLQAEGGGLFHLQLLEQEDKVRVHDLADGPDQHPP